METYCKWCTAFLGNVKADQNIITYGLCPACSKRLTSNGVFLKEYIDLFNAPIIVVDNDWKVRAANDIAKKSLGSDIPEIDGHPPGKAWECVHARESGGCGNTVHCKTCAIRIALVDTLTTGKSHYKVSAYPDVMLGDTKQKVEFLISTEKIAEVVLVRIDSLKAVA